MKDHILYTKKIPVLFLIIFFLIYPFYSCDEEPELKSPHKIGSKDRVNIVSGEEAIMMIDEMHGLSVAPNANIIVEYGANKKDMLYISYYRDGEDAQKDFQQMIDKMETAKNSPFSHLMRLPEYESDVYFTLGMGAIHYIYCSSNYILWFQTEQTFGRNLPAELLNIYPINTSNST